jgi:hypothetical protein
MTGRPQLDVPLVKIKRLSEQGLGGWAITRELKAEGYSVSDRTVYRRINELGLVKSACPPHFWDIDMFVDCGKYHARCKKCGAKRDYLAWPPGEMEKPFVIMPKEDKEPPPQKRGRPRKTIPILS